MVNFNNYSKINYESDSIDVALNCSKYLLENDFYNNSEETNIELLEKGLMNYSIIKLYEWNADLEKLDSIDNLSYLLNELAKMIPTRSQKKDFFTQYTHCIIYIVSKINKQEPISWEKIDSDAIGYGFTTENNRINKFVTDEAIDPEMIPIVLLNEIKNMYTKEKRPIKK